MKQKFLIFGGLIILIFLLIGLNAASYVQREKKPDSELSPNRSTYNYGVTGTRAFFDLLTETGRKVVRWQEPPDELLYQKNAPKTFVITGDLKREFSEAEAAKLLQWVDGGGKLVIIDREPPAALIPSRSNWKLKFAAEDKLLGFGVDPSDAVQMTANTAAATPLQPTIYNKSVNSVQPSRLAAAIGFERVEQTGKGEGIGGTAPPPPKPVKSATPVEDEDYFSEEEFESAPTPKPTVPRRFETNSAKTPDNKNVVPDFDPAPLPPPPPSAKAGTPKPMAADQDEQLPKAEISGAPVVHLANKEKNLLVDIPYGAGRIVYLSDPFIVSNAGLRLADNVQLGVNIVAARDGTIAFDEYHQGFGGNNNRLLEYFAGTPVISIFIQIALLIALVFFSQSRRFARAVPEKEPDRLSKLEYVSAMAELQQRTKAFDLALENIYNDFRRRVARLFGVDNHTTTRRELAHFIAERTKLDANEVEDVMFKCEEIIHGERTSKKEVVRLAGRLRQFEEKLGLKRNRQTKI